MDGVTATYEALPMPHAMPHDWPEVPIIEDLTVTPDFGETLLSRRNRAHVLILPRDGSSLRWIPEFSDAARPVYCDRDTSSLFDLEDRGLKIAMLHEESERDDFGQKGAEVVVAMGLFIAQTLAEHEIVGLYQHFCERNARTADLLKERGRDDARVVLSIDVLYAKKTAGGFKIEAKGVKGPAQETVDLFARMIRELNEDG